MKTEYFTCECTHPEHTLRFCYFDPMDGFPGELYLEIMLNTGHLSVFRRIWVAIKYILNMKLATNCSFDTWSLAPADLNRMIDFLSKVKENENE